jgi:N4-gp56 family major capsid protein
MANLTRLDGIDRGGELGMGKGLINPQVLAEYLDWKMMDAIKFAPLCNVNRDLEGRPGSVLTLPKYTFIGLADVVDEGKDVPISLLEADSVEKKVHKIGKGATVTDEAILSAYGNPVDEVAKQLLMAIAGKIDNDCVAAFREATMNAPVDAFNRDAVIDMIAKFGEDIEEEMTLMINPAHLAALRKEDDFVYIANGQKVISGEIGQIFGCRIVVSNKVGEKEAFLVKNGAVEIIMKRNVMVEADRDIVNKTTTYVADEHYVVYLRDESKIVKATIA